jgi:hypothetical protein
MWLENGLELDFSGGVSPVSGPDSAAQGDNLSKYESAAREMVVA